MKVLVACEFSGTVRQAFRDAGHDAWSCDLVLARDGSPYHVQDDVLNHLLDGWDLMIAHPPCTYLSNVSVCHLHRDPSRWSKMLDACSFFLALLNAPIPRICIENPVPHKYARAYVPTYSQIVCISVTDGASAPVFGCATCHPCCRPRLCRLPTDVSVEMVDRTALFGTTIISTSVRLHRQVWLVLWPSSGVVSICSCSIFTMIIFLKTTTAAICSSSTCC